MKRFEHPRIYAFEPVPVAFRSLLAATKRFKEVTAYNLAIGERNGQVTFHVASDVQSSSILRQNESFGAAFADAAVTRTIELEMQTLDTALRNVAIDSPVLLKLDVQGYETRVIDGARSFLGAVDVIVAETSFAPLYEGEGAFLALVDLLDDCGFDFVRPVGTLVSPTSGAFLQMDALFLRKRVATVGPEIAMRRRVNGLVAG
jgi:FkbM family methyltransferase